MASDGDAENQRNNNEQTPLLDEQQSDQQTDQSCDEPKQKKQASWYIWRAFWAIVAALVLAVFIRGWIDAGGDVEVGVTSSYLSASVQLIFDL